MMDSETAHIVRGTPAFRRTNLALFSAGFATFALLYCVQPLLPVFSAEFHVGAAASSLSLSLTTALLAVAMLLVGSLSEAWGRRGIMILSLFAVAGLTVLSAATRSWQGLLVLRALEGLAFAGLPALAMAYLGEEMHRSSIGLAMGLYIAGNGLGGMLGRLLTSFLTDVVSWRFALGVLGALGLVAAAIFWRRLPPSRHFHARPLHLGHLASSFGAHLRERALLALFAEGFLLMGGFVTTYNYITYRLLAPPFTLTQTQVGFIFVLYLVGIFSSAWMGALADRRDRGTVLVASLALMLVGILLTIPDHLLSVVLGIGVVTFGFFGGHSVASGWVGLAAHEARAQASALYLFFYYVGSSIAGVCGGFFWSSWGWPGVVGFVAALIAAGLLLAFAMPAPAAMPASAAQPRP
ncbi:MAG TPA: MFS transporter [Gemmatimonadaceae bacterium]|nr:MFS transporter [Gemmatimonadaceae bacterium]